jgi:hypothetical protein
LADAVDTPTDGAIIIISTSLLESTWEAFAPAAINIGLRTVLKSIAATDT